VIIFGVPSLFNTGLQVLAAHSAYSPSQVVMPAVGSWATTGVDNINNVNIASNFFMFIFLGMVGSQGRVSPQILW